MDEFFQVCVTRKAHLLRWSSAAPPVARYVPQSLYIETEHLLLGVLREDKAFASQRLESYSRIEDIRRSIAQRGKTGVKIATSINLPLSRESKRVLAYAAEESERMAHDLIDTPHLLLGLLREERCFAARLLHERGLKVKLVRERVRQSKPLSAQGSSALVAGLDQWLAERQAPGSIWAFEPKRAGRGTTHIALYAGGEPQENEKDQDLAPAATLAPIQRQIDSIVGGIKRAIANHEFVKVHFFSDEERKERENQRRLREQFNLEERPPRVPFLCIEIIGQDRFSEIRKRCDGYLAEGVAEVWLLDPGLKRAYTVTKIEGLREVKGEILQIANPPPQMDLKSIFE